MKRLMLIGAAAVAALGSGAQAQTYSIAGDFGGSVFTYGYGTGGTSFTQFTTRGGCQANFDCFRTPGVDAIVQKNNGAQTTGEIVTPSGGIEVHPGSFGGQDAIIRFTATAAGIYDIAGAFARLNTTRNGDGVFGRVFVNNSQQYSTFLSPASYGSSTAYTLSGISLGVGGTIDFLANYNGAFQFDSTGISGTISRADAVSGGVPEPATWLMMILGFGAIGIVLRPRHKGIVRVRYSA